MSRIGRALRLSVAAVLLTVAGTSGVSAAPATPTMGATLSHDGACLLTVTATWKGVRIDSVDVFWYRDGAYIATSEAPGGGPNGGTLRGRVATLNFGPATPVSTTHNWHALVTYYSGPINQGQTTTNTLSIQCNVGV